jgi:hypothetical protein
MRHETADRTAFGRASPKRISALQWAASFRALRSHLARRLRARSETCLARRCTLVADKTPGCQAKGPLSALVVVSTPLRGADSREERAHALVVPTGP